MHVRFGGCQHAHERADHGARRGEKILDEKVVALIAQMKSADAMVELAVTSAIMKEKAQQEQAVNSAYKSGQRDAMEQMQAMRKLFG